MFTGIVEDIGAVEAVEDREGQRDFSIRPGRITGLELAAGDSIAVDGACLTVTDPAADRFRVTAVAETLRRTTLGDLRPGARVNLERAARLADRIGGHLVQGHVDGVGEIAGRRTDRGNLEIRIGAPIELLRYIVEKGSIAVDGISLTVAGVGESTFAIALIPHTIQGTTLADKNLGGRVNLEVDIIAKYVERLLGGHLEARK